jgi:hypothetical protein
MSPGKPLEHALLKLAGCLSLLPIQRVYFQSVRVAANNVLLVPLEGWYYNDHTPLGGRRGIGAVRDNVLQRLKQ